MGKLNLNNQQLSRIKSFALRGDDEAAMVSAILDGVKVVELTADAEAANAIVVNGQIKDLDGSAIAGVQAIFVKSVPVAGTGAATVGTGTAIAGDASTEVYLETDAAGAFTVSVANLNAEKNLVIVTVDDGTTEMLPLTFA